MYRGSFIEIVKRGAKVEVWEDITSLVPTPYTVFTSGGGGQRGVNAQTRPLSCRVTR